MITYPLNNIEYEAADAELFHCTRTSGIWAKNDFPFSVTGADNSITIGTGIAWINNEKFSGKVVANKETTILDLGVPDSIYLRIDVVAIQFDANANETKLVVKNGVPSSSPLIPAPSRSASLYELYLCKIERPAGAAVVTASNVGDLRLDPQYCGLMADSVTSVNTDQINQQIDAFIEQLRDTIDDVQSGAGVMLENYWSEDGKIPVSRGGTGRDELTENSFLVGSGTNPVKLITPSEAREAMGLGKSTDLLSVQTGGTGKSSFTADYFLRGNGSNPVKTSSPEQVLDDIGGQKRIEVISLGLGTPVKIRDLLNMETVISDYHPLSNSISVGRYSDTFGYGFKIHNKSKLMLSASVEFEHRYETADFKVSDIELSIIYYDLGHTTYRSIASVGNQCVQEKVASGIYKFTHFGASIPLLLDSINPGYLYLQLSSSFSGSEDSIKDARFTVIKLPT